MLQAYGGKLEAGQRSLQKALSATDDAGNRLWLLTRLGEVAEWRGQPKVAEKHYREGLGLGRDEALTTPDLGEIWGWSGSGGSGWPGGERVGCVSASSAYGGD